MYMPRPPLPVQMHTREAYGFPNQIPMMSGGTQEQTLRNGSDPRQNFDPELADALAEIAREISESADEQKEGEDDLKQSRFMGLMNQLASGEARLDQESQEFVDAMRDRKLVDGNGVEWSGDFRGVSSNMQEDARREAEQTQPEPIQDDNPDDLERILRIPPPIPTLMPLRPGGETVFGAQHGHPHSQSHSYGDQDAVLMNDGASVQRRKSVHFSSEEGEVAPLGNGVPASFEEALHHTATAVPGATSQWEDSALDDDLSVFDEEAFMTYNGDQRIARDGRIGVGALEGWGEMQKDWEGLQRSLPQGSTAKGMGVDDRYLFQSRNPYTDALQEVEEIGQGRESPTIKVCSLADNSALNNQ